MDPWVYGAGETRAYIAQTGKWPKINSITINLDETKWDRIPPMSRTFLGESGARWGPNWVIWGWGDGGIGDGPTQSPKMDQIGPTEVCQALVKCSQGEKHNFRAMFRVPGPREAQKSQFWWWGAGDVPAADPRFRPRLRPVPRMTTRKRSKTSRNTSQDPPTTLPGPPGTSPRPLSISRDPPPKSAQRLPRDPPPRNSPRTSRDPPGTP